MNEVEIVRTPEMIAGEINYIKQKAAERLLEDSVEIGRRLQEAKALVGHGEWSAWLEKNVNYSQSTADNLMRIAAEYGDRQIDMMSGRSKAEVFAHLSYSQAVALFSLPEDKREEFVCTHDMRDMSAREVADEVKAVKAELEEALKRAKDAENASADAVKKGLEAVAEKEKAVKEKSEAVEKMKELKAKAARLKEAEETVKRLQEAEKRQTEMLEAAQKELEELREQEPAQLSVDSAVSEEREDEIRQEVAEKVRAEYAQKIAAVSDEHLHAFKFAFEEWQQDFRKMVGELKMISKTETADKLRGKIGEKLGEMEEEIGT